MPVWARGALDSGTIIIFNHGGPGGTAQYANAFSFYQELEKRYGIVYWDQRCSGISQGNPDPATFTIEDFTADLDLVVDTVKTAYSPRSIFMYGVSWGGTLGMAYLTDPARQSKIAGFIEEGGGHNMVLLMNERMRIIRAYAESWIDAGSEGEFWRRALDFFDANPDPRAWDYDQYMEFSSYFNATKPYTFEPDRAPGEITGPDAGMIFFSPLSLALFFNQGSLVPRFDILGLDLNPRMGSITTPVLLAWGEYDINSPPALAANAVEFLGTASEDIHLHIFANSGHNPCIDQSAAYLPLFVDFIEEYK